MDEGFFQELRSRLRLENEPRERIDPRAWIVWMIHGIISSFIIMVIAILFWRFGIAAFDLPPYLGIAGLILAVLYVPWAVIISPWLTMRFWRYEVRADEMETQHGVFIIRRHLIPMVRVQHVDTEHGPLMRYFGLATLHVSTAATRFPIPALPKDRAEELRGEISALARVSDEDV